ncbi:MAG: tRNA (guanosine(37)-N1)-methyltransferase TrmD [Candidatus Chisholmbacteria bacterium RIFCSPLOWO2_01_FULL_50_28]|uniref:tRNA (guanine-N(1)-)-methyltransferase n=1 Tax=Candidatus Chisholmbacteria bacterium RIFCSPHIGHO2_01_FULL_52_32 TaxID=1797591 RepID=A0A1G1VT45_9BACT|nr:MAG: tRNA (guanosine(37)-N1)-methyltransferase TrmD [Candidatus Chisholmbacteria bacterium RIFCSPHIGHO2_01_FULL_52_32]OGY20051.1 MAG: tRNA (guanosine(37)-N1)-methyltransferase TrmD [Candidatus Chisholmbacteria bacterium RIFCSPLOWO2_01_FULL_50_28]
MRIDILTVFPQMFAGPLDASIVARAKEHGLVEVWIHDLRRWTTDRRKTVDDRPYGGGSGMVMMVEPIDRALHDLKLKVKSEKLKVILLSPQGKVFSQARARDLAKLDNLILIAGHYEGVDERVREHLVDEEISIGDYVLTGGELPAMVLVDSIVRLIPGVLEKPEATELESFSTFHAPPEYPKSTGRAVRGRYPLLEYPQYTRPANFKGWKVPEILRSGDHAGVETWQMKQALKRTRERRPDLLKGK